MSTNRISICCNYFQDVEHLVFGFISGLQSQLYSTFPVAITELCMKYFVDFDPNEKFDAHSNDISLCPSNASITSKKHTQMVYGNSIVDPRNKLIRKYVWTLKVVKMPDAKFLLIGITGNKKINLQKDYKEEMTVPYYGMSATGYMLHNYLSDHHAMCINGGNGRDLAVGDVITMTLDIDQETLTFEITQYFNCNKWINIITKDVQYSLAVCLSSNQAIELLRFETKR